LQKFTKQKLSSATWLIVLLTSVVTYAQETPQEYIIRFDRALSDNASLEEILAVKGVPGRKLKKRQWRRAKLTKTQVAKLRQRGISKFIERDVRRFPFADNDSQSTPYGIGKVQALPSDLMPGDTPIKVCVIDSGYDINHHDLPGYDRVTGVSQTGDLWDFPGDDHGTHVAGTIAALDNGIGVVGVHRGSNLSLHIVKVFNDNGDWSYASDLVDAIDSCVSAGAKIASMSLGGDYSSLESEAFDEARNAGILSVAAAGNSGNSAYSYPASYDSVVSIAATDASNSLAGFSQRNNQVELAAPGVDVESTVIGNGYASFGGTSMATPHVSAVAALVWSHHPACDAVGIRRAMAWTAKDLGSPGRDNSYGHGLVQAAAAKIFIDANGCDLDEPPEPPPPETTPLISGQRQDSLSGFAGEQLYFSLTIPDDTNDVDIVMSGGSGDPDLYVRWDGELPDASNWDCRPYSDGSQETCSLKDPSTGEAKIMIEGYTSFNGVSLIGTVITDSGGGGNNPISVTLNIKSQNTIDVLWSGASGARVDILKNGSQVTTKRNRKGMWTDKNALSSEYYTVCELRNLDVCSEPAYVDGYSPGNQPPNVSVSVSATDVREGEVVTFNASATDPDDDTITYYWSTGNAFAVGASSLDAVFETEGSYTITVRAEDPEGASDEASIDVTVNPPNQAPVAKILTSTQNGRLDVPITFTGASSTDDQGIVSYEWNFGDESPGISGPLEVEHSFSEIGIYNVSLTVGDAEGETGTAIANVSIVANAVPIINTLTGPSETTTGELVTFFASASDDDGDSLSYVWAIENDPQTAGGDTFSTSFSNTGLYEIGLQVTDGFGGIDNASVSLSVTQPLSNLELTLTSSRRGVRLVWKGVEGDRVDIYRNGVNIGSKKTSKSFIDRGVRSGDEYRVCEQDDTSSCSPVVTAP